MFSNRLLHRQLPNRVLLPARSAAPWPAARSALEEAAAGTSDLASLPLDDQGGELGERRAMFTVARDCFAARYGLTDPSVIEPPDHLDRPDFGLVLALRMGAL
ncbi:hypothetical protein SMD11_1014 [Streptomyces albireticuli]|uniref:Uncharacterized protein n=1 Tax=Streptomyces albireticuli TaxID=1940 RepID=A0A1Z2KXC0_9ACTN|nr:hypothetical protein [Streptomyces albireticuli]ARZ66679.1 hypothetical protein SMD11_1014 [Streptomyces albireticuli]